MKTLVRPAPFPEELDRGYLGRVMRINSYRCEKEILAAIAEDCGQEEKSAREFTTHERLSHIAGLSSEQFAQNHTTVPLRRAITSFFPEIRHGSLDRQSLLYNSAMQLRYPAAYFCPHCVEADIEFHGVSYWRRDHQTPGQLWCPKHQSALHFVSEGDPLMVPPAELINNAREVPGDWIEEARGNQYVDRFLAIAAEVFDQQAPFGVAAVVPMLREAGIAMGFQANAGTVKSALISDRICAVFPKRWLGVVFRDLVEKNEGQFLFQVDGALYMRKSSSSVTAYLLVLAILYSSADAALNALRAARDGTSRLVPTRQRDASLVVPEDEVLMEQYVLARGSYVAMMSALDIPRHRLAAKLAALGLPNLAGGVGGAGEDRIGALEAFYVQKKPLSECLPPGGMTIRQLEGLVRQCGPNVTRLLSKMLPPGGRRSRSRKGKTLLPCHEGALQRLTENNLVGEV